MGVTIPVPQRSLNAFTEYRGKSPQNPGLIFDRFAPDSRGNATAKREHLTTVRELSEKVDVGLLKAWNSRWEAAVRAGGAEPFEMRTDWRFVAGLGRKGPLEIGFTFHRYGFPILPGSSVKGIARAWALREIAQALDQEDLSVLDGLLSTDDEEKFEREFGKLRANVNAQTSDIGTEFRKVFGTTAAAGCAVFFDAIPRSRPTLEIDIMNPHFPKYYQDKTAPKDSKNPSPVYFLAVAPGTTFRFAVGWRGVLDEATEALRQKAEAWLKNGLMELGAGAKTSAGYGYFIQADTHQQATKANLERSTQTIQTRPADSPLASQIRRTPQNQIKSSIGNFVNKWQQLPDGPEKVEVARALVEQMNKSGIVKDKKWCDKDWVKDILNYVAQIECRTTGDEG